MSKIITVTLNPSLDRTLFTHYMALGYPNTLTTATRLDPAGRGVNVSRALSRLNQDTHALILLGDDAIASSYRALIDYENFASTMIKREGLTRSNTIILDSGTHQETQLIEEAHSHTDEEDDGALISEKLHAVLNAGDTVALSGILPKGVPVKIYASLTERIHAAGGKVVLAADGIALEIGLKARPDIIALRHNELEAFFNYPVRTPGDVVHSARKISERSGGSTVVVSQQEIEFGVLVNEQNGWIAYVPPTEAPSGTTSGVHDAALAGFLAGFANSGAERLPEALRLSMAAAAYARAQVGNEFGDMELITPYLESIEVESIENASL